MVATMVLSGVVVHPAEHEPVGRDREARHHHRRANQREQEPPERGASGERGAEPREHRAQHVELPVRDVDDAHHPEHQRQPQRRDRQHTGGHGAFEQRQQQVRAEAHRGWEL